MNTELTSSLVSSDLSVNVSPVADSAPASRSTLLARRMILLRSRYAFGMARKLYRGALAAREAGRTDYASRAMVQAAGLVRRAHSAMVDSVQGQHDSNAVA